MEEKKLFEVWFLDGDKKLLEAENIVTVISYLVYEKGYRAMDVIKVEERI